MLLEFYLHLKRILYTYKYTILSNLAIYFSFPGKKKKTLKLTDCKYRNLRITNTIGNFIYVAYSRAVIVICWSLRNALLSPGQELFSKECRFLRRLGGPHSPRRQSRGRRPWSLLAASPPGRQERLPGGTTDNGECPCEARSFDSPLSLSNLFSDFPVSPVIL